MYKFLDTAENLVSDIMNRYDRLGYFFQNSGMLRSWARSYSAYYGKYFYNDGPGLGTAGEQGELVTLYVNHYRNILKHIYGMTTANKLVFDALSTNSDIECRNAAIVANSVLDYYFYEKKSEEQCKQAFEMALVFGTAFLKVCWEPNTVAVGLDGNEQPVYRGEPRFYSFSPYDVIIDPTKHDWKKQNWAVTREVVNKWDLIAVFPELAEKIEALPKIADLQHFMPGWDVDEDSVWLFKAYHKATPALPKGRYTLFCENSVILSDEFNNPYPNHELPIYCIRPDVKYGGAYGHTIGFDLLPIQESMNLLHSSIMTNQKAFAVQNVAVPKDAGVNPVEVPGGLNLLEYNVVEGVPGGGKPEALQLCATPQEVFRYNQELSSAAELISGVNAAARGAPNTNLVSGTAIAIVTTQATTFNSAAESAYINMAEWAATFLVQVLQHYQIEPELLAIAGKANSYAVRQFVGKDLKPIQRVRITVGNALSKTLAGRLEVSNNMLNQGMLSSPQEYLEVLQTGTLTPILENKSAQFAYIREENDRLAKGEQVMMLATDNHQKHIEEHMVLTFRPDIRANNVILQGVLNHILEHVEQLEQMSMENPLMLSIALQQPLVLPTPNAPGYGQPPPPGPAQAPTGAPAIVPGDEASQGAEAALESGAAPAAMAGLKRAEKELEAAQ